MKKRTRVQKVSFHLQSGKSPFVIKTDDHDFKLPGIFTFVGNTGSGKTYSCVALNRYFEDKNYTTRTFLVSATHPSNPIYKNLDTLSKEDMFEPSVKVMNDVLEEVKKLWKDYKDYTEYCKVYRKYMNHPDFLSVKEEMLLEFHSYEPMKRVERPRCMVILDDVQGMGMYTQNPNSIITHMTIKHRHIPLSMCFLVQSWTGLPRVLRLNTTVFVIFDTSDMKQLIQMYESFGNLVEKEHFIQMFKKAMMTYKGFLVVDKEPQQEHMRFRNGFHTPFDKSKMMVLQKEQPKNEASNAIRSKKQSSTSKDAWGVDGDTFSSPSRRSFGPSRGRRRSSQTETASSRIGGS